MNHKVKQIIDDLVAKHPKIVQESGRMGGQPTLLETRVRVIDILNALYQENSIQGVIDRWDWKFSEDDIKAAIAFSQDFIDEVWVQANRE